jgi:hypothetical protein
MAPVSIDRQLKGRMGMGSNFPTWFRLLKSWDKRNIFPIVPASIWQIIRSMLFSTENCEGRRNIVIFAGKS